MKNRIYSKWIYTLVLVTGVGFTTVLSGSAALGQENKQSDQDLTSRKVSVEVENAEVVYALKMLFKSVNVGYSFGSGIQGSITVSIKDVSFKAALETILKASPTPLTYRLENGIYMISPKVETASIDREPAPTETPEGKKKDTRTVVIHLNYADAEDIARMFGGTVLMNRFGGSTALIGNGRGGSGNGFGNGNGNSFGNGGNFGNGGIGNGSFGSGNLGNGSFGSGGVTGGNFGSGNFGSGPGSGGNNRR